MTATRRRNASPCLGLADDSGYAIRCRTQLPQLELVWAAIWAKNAIEPKKQLDQYGVADMVSAPQALQPTAGGGGGGGFEKFFFGLPPPPNPSQNSVPGVEAQWKWAQVSCQVFLADGVSRETAALRRSRYRRCFSAGVRALPERGRPLAFLGGGSVTGIAAVTEIGGFVVTGLGALWVTGFPPPPGTIWRRGGGARSRVSTRGAPWVGLSLVHWLVQWVLDWQCVQKGVTVGVIA